MKIPTVKTDRNSNEQIESYGFLNFLNHKLNAQENKVHAPKDMAVLLFNTSWVNGLDEKDFLIRKGDLFK